MYPAETIIEDSVQALSADSVSLIIPYRLSYSLSVELSMSTKDIETTAYRFSMQFLKAENIEELGVKIKSIYKSENRTKHNFFTYYAQKLK